MNLRKYYGLLALILSALQLFSQEKTVTYYQDRASYPSDLVVSLKHVKADIRFQPAENLVIGDVDLTIVANRYSTDSISVYTPDFVISKVSLMTADEGAHRLPAGNTGKMISALIPIKWKLIGPNLVIRSEKGSSFLIKGEKYIIRISYETRPLAGPIYFIGWRPEEEGKRKVIWAHRPHNWLPYIEARVTADMFFTFDGRYKIFSNGERIEVKSNPDGTKTWHYAMRKDHPYFSTSLVIGDYEYKTSVSKRGVPLEYWYYPGLADRVPVTYKYTERMFGFFEQEIGVNYPYTQYREAPLTDYMYGGMETTTSTVFGDYMLIDPHAWWQRNFINVNAHELAHQWFGDGIAHLVNKDVWLTESFGTYYAKMFERSVYGEEYYENLRNDEMSLAFEAAKKNDYPVGGSQGGVQRIYQKGSLVLDMLWDVMGEKEFHDAVKLYAQRYMYNYAQTCDFIRCLYDATGKSYNWFFDEWILRGGEPHYKVSYSLAEDSLGGAYTEVDAEQIQEVNELKPLFRMPVGIRVYYRNGTSDSITAWIEEKEQKINIPNPGKAAIDFVLFDPGRRILKKLSFERSYEELASQLMKAPLMIDRYDALQALRIMPVAKKKDLLILVYEKNHFHLMRSAILDQMSKDRSEEAVALFRQALHDKDANVRKAALVFLDTIPPALKKDAESCLADSSYLNIQFALERLCSSFPSETDHYLELTKDMEGWRGMNIRMAWLEIAIRSGKYENLQELIPYSGPKYEFETRMNAFSAMQKLNYIDPVTTENAKAASKHWNFKLCNAGKAYLNFFKIEQK
ncbi:MAG: M1 family aminopeptidase [Bacteroidetes bacterium]|nr:M1 family aminopeptidase [Bacteroidota bacterium]